jgi:hypothetical protein
MADQIIKPVDIAGNTPSNRIDDVPAADLPTMDLNRMLPRQLSTGSTRGTQTVGYGNTKIDGTNNTITIGAPDGSSIGMGAVPGTSPTEYGFFSLDKNKKLIMKIVNGTWYVNNPDNNTNVMQSGILPDKSIGWAVASEGNNVSDGFS